VLLANALTIDVEDYFQVSAFAAHIDRSEWDRMPCRVERNIDLILFLLDAARANATFFTLGWVAERYPQVVRRIVDQGHEIASHGYSHRRATEQEPDDFFADIKLAKRLLEDISGQEVKGYRAPSFSVSKKNPWAFECIRDAGYRYSSSIYPVRHDHYGMPDAPRFPYQPLAGLTEVPISTNQFFHTNVPAGGGGYFRLLPYGVSKWLITRVNRVDAKPAMFYFHPWELDPEQPRVSAAGWKSKFRHYVNLHQTEQRLKRLLSDFRWDRVDRVFLDLP